MFRFLLAEQNETTRRELRERLETAFPECTVELTRSADETIQKISSATLAYDAVIVTFRWAAQDSTNICSAIRQRMPNTPVAHIAEFEAQGDAAIKHLQDEHNTSPRTDSMTVFKTKPEWGTDLINQIGGYLCSNLVTAQLDNLFGDGTEQDSGDYGGRSADRRSLTSSIATTASDIKEYWTYLRTAVQNRVEQHFEVVRATGTDRRTTKPEAIYIR